jgi:hypothetical protein
MGEGKKKKTHFRHLENDEKNANWVKKKKTHFRHLENDQKNQQNG